MRRGRDEMTDSGRVTQGRGRLFESVLDTVGDTPCIRINTLAPRHVTVYVKAEFFNPAGSVKDRLALSIIEEARRRKYERLLLDTLPKLTTAIALYRSLGFREVGPYLSCPTPGAICFELSLS
jgi:GNAT superfamily N-acetyltransferase